MTTSPARSLHTASLLDGEIVEDRDVLAATFGTHIDDLPQCPFTPADPLIVTRTNPVDADGVGHVG